MPRKVGRLHVLAVATCLVACLWPTTTGARAEQSLSVLFVGNSYTRFNNLPRIVRRLADSDPGGAKLRTALVARGGMQLRAHWRDGEAARAIRRGDYTHVVLQPHSLEALSYPGRMGEYAGRFERIARDRGSALVLWETWPRRRGNRAYREGQVGRTPEEMQMRVRAAVRPLADRLSASLAPVGRAWLSAMEREPDIDLHRPDGTHPSLAGTYLSACVLYEVITGGDVTTLAYRPYPMRRRTARTLRALAHEAVGGNTEHRGGRIQPAPP